MVNEKYLLVAKNLADRNKNRLNTKRSPKEQERDKLFYWILSRLEWSIENCWPGKTSHQVTIKVDHVYDDGRVLLAHGSIADYLSEYVKGDDFYSVLADVANIFNAIKSPDEGYSFYSNCFLPESIIVRITTK